MYTCTIPLRDVIIESCGPVGVPAYCVRNCASKSEPKIKLITQNSKAISIFNLTVQKYARTHCICRVWDVFLLLWSLHHGDLIGQIKNKKPKK